MAPAPLGPWDLGQTAVCTVVIVTPVLTLVGDPRGLSAARGLQVLTLLRHRVLALLLGLSDGQHRFAQCAEGLPAYPQANWLASQFLICGARNLPSAPELGIYFTILI